MSLERETNSSLTLGRWCVICGVTRMSLERETKEAHRVLISEEEDRDSSNNYKDSKLVCVRAKLVISSMLSTKIHYVCTCIVKIGQCECILISDQGPYSVTPDSLPASMQPES